MPPLLVGLSLLVPGFPEKTVSWRLAYGISRKLRRACLPSECAGRIWRRSVLERLPGDHKTSQLVDGRQDGGSISLQQVIGTMFGFLPNDSGLTPALVWLSAGLIPAATASTGAIPQYWAD
jgi:hypothetical protein